MLIKQIINEDADFESMKSVIAAKIKELPYLMLGEKMRL